MTDGDLSVVITGDLFASLPDWGPTVDQVAAYIRARTKTQGGDEAGTFNPAAEWETNEGKGTRPTQENVEQAIANSVGSMIGTIGLEIDGKYHDQARRVAALKTAMLIELTYWPEQVNTGRSTYPQLKELYDQEWENLLTAMGISTDTGGGAVPADAGFPSYGGFPTTAIGMETPW